MQQKHEQQPLHPTLRAGAEMMNWSYALARSLMSLHPSPEGKEPTITGFASLAHSLFIDITQKAQNVEGEQVSGPRTDAVFWATVVRSLGRTGPEPATSVGDAGMVMHFCLTVAEVIHRRHVGDKTTKDAQISCAIALFIFLRRRVKGTGGVTNVQLMTTFQKLLRQ